MCAIVSRPVEQAGAADSEAGDPGVRSAAIGYLDGVLRVSDLVRRGASRRDLVQAVADVIHAHLGWQVVVVNFVRPEHGDVIAAACAGSAEVAAELLGQRSPLTDWQVLLAAGDRWHGACFVPAGRVEWEVNGVPSWRPTEEMEASDDAWRAEDALLIPLQDSPGRLLGIVSVDQPLSGRRPSMSDCATLTAFCAHLEAALELASLGSAQQRRSSALDRVGELTEFARGTTNSRVLLGEVVRAAGECLGLEAVEAVLVENGELGVVARWGRPQAWFAGSTPDELAATLERGDRREGAIVLKDGETPTVACALTDLDGRLLGAVAATLTDVFGEDGAIRRGLLRFFADVAQAHMASSAHRVLAHSEARKDAILVSSLDAIVSVDSRSAIIEFNPAAERTFGYRRSQVMGRNMAELIIPERLRDAHRTGLAGYLAGRSTGSIIGQRIEIPAMRADGSEFPAEIAVVRIESDGPATFTAFLRDISDRREARRELERERDQAHHAATHDPLTGLLNLRGLREAYGNNFASDVAVISVGLGGLAAVGQAFGQTMSDGLVRTAAQHLAAITGAAGLLARVDDRVFAATAPLARIETVAQAIAKRMSGSVELDGITLQPEYAVGVAAPDDVGLDELLRRAAVARAAARDTVGAGPRLRVFSPEHDTWRSRLSFASKLRQAIGASELELHYQPLFNGDGRHLTGLEALVRWRHDDRLIPPLEFIPLAESTGLIAPLGEWVAGEACRQIAEWKESGLPVPIVAINVSPYQLSHHDVATLLERELSQHRLSPSDLCVEVTETALQVGDGQVIALLEHLAKIGVRCALDDFGAEYSSLTRLSALPFQMVKIDRSFLERVPVEPRATAFLRAVVGLARSLGLLVTVEGIETPEQLTLIGTLEVAQTQGYLLGRPRSPADTTQLITDLTEPQQSRD